ncbi:Hypothetical protein NTJ_10988 [Nesidiocoris tenuis]|uniref:C-type lectin domain-containing protein n=1 Tax=Nesidiocoris tenuis TaxID=355587 RepID=A0ABN7B174_9HEMI|nr:Hypothetical protein NTJ_10988 [Nesidiocoris tenuis]
MPSYKIRYKQKPHQLLQERDASHIVEIVFHFRTRISECAELLVRKLRKHPTQRLFLRKMESACIRFLLVVGCLHAAASQDGSPRAAVLGRAKVEGQGFSVLARNGKQCLNLCNLQPACDSANYDILTKKCRVFTRCSPTTLMQKSPTHIHYTKRPLITEDGYTYHPESDSCLKLMDKVTDFAEADAVCKGQNGRLVSITDPGINEEAAALLKRSGAQFAWIGLIDYRQEGNPLHSDGRRVSETRYFPTEEQSARNDPRRNCWALSDNGVWHEHSCKNRTQFSICQVVSYYSR